MSEGLERFNRLAAAEAEDELFKCFASRRWARRVAASRPYRSPAEIIGAAESAWSELSDTEWLAAFAAHPRIGERGGHAPAASEREQSSVTRAAPETLAVLAAENRAYEQRFGHVFLIAASGLAADEILEALRRRMKNNAARELEIAAREQRKITRLRLEGMLGA